jgi:hypothetical protein
MVDREVTEIVNFDDNKQDRHNFQFPSAVIATEFIENLLNESGPEIRAALFISDLREYFMVAFNDSEFAALFDILLPDEKIPVHFVIQGKGESIINLKYCALYSALRGYFNNYAFHTRYKTNQYSEHDHRFFNGMFLIYELLFPGESENKNLDNFSRLVYQAGRLDSVRPISDN